MLCAQLRLAGEAAYGCGQRRRVAGRNEQRAVAVLQQLARRRRVGGDQRRSASKCLERLVRDHAARLRGCPEDAERTAGSLNLARQLLVLHPLDPLDVRRPFEQQRVELAAADDPERDLRRQPCSRKDRFDPVQRDQLADEERVEAPRRLPARPKEPLLGADEADRQPFGRQRSELGQVSCVLLRVCDDEVCAPERDPIGAMQEPGLPRTGAEEPAIFDDGLVEGHERVEDHRPAACDSLGGGDVEVAGVAHDQCVAAHAPAAEEEPRLGEGEPAAAGTDPERPLVPSPLPYVHVPFDDVDPGAAKAGDHLRIPRVVALVRPEVENPQSQRRISSTCSWVVRPPPVRSSWWLAMSSLTRPSERSCTPTTTRRTPSVSSGRWPIASPISLSTVR